MEYILALHIFTKKQKRNKICYHSIDIYTYTEIFLFYKCKMIQMSYSTHLLIATGFSTLQSKYNMLSNYHSCKHLTPKWHINTHKLDSIKFTHNPGSGTSFSTKERTHNYFPLCKYNYNSNSTPLIIFSQFHLHFSNPSSCLSPFSWCLQNKITLITYPWTVQSTSQIPSKFMK